MIYGIGIDIVNNERIKHTVEKFGEKFLKRIYSEQEIQYCMSKSDPAPFLAARFAVKEAFIKALSLKNDIGISYKEISVEGHGKRKKKIVLYGKAKEYFKQQHIQHLHFSITHDNEVSAAVVILEK